MDGRTATFPRKVSVLQTAPINHTLDSSAAGLCAGVLHATAAPRSGFVDRENPPPRGAEPNVTADNVEHAAPQVWNAGAPKTVLFIAARFPPAASVGAIRIRKFVKYLNIYDWRPVVITGTSSRSTPDAHAAHHLADEEALRDLPVGSPVFRLSPDLDDWPSHVSRWLADRIGRRMPWIGRDVDWWSEGLNWRLGRLHERASFPDAGIWRLPATVKLAVDLHRRFRFDAIFTSGMPFSDHLTGLAVRRILRRPWLVDFRDPWVEYIHWNQWNSAGGQWLTRASEAAVVRNASFVVSVNDRMTRRFADRYRRQRPGKFVTIPNGFDPFDFERLSADDDDSLFRIVYAGSLYGKRSPAKILEAFRRFLRETPGARDHAEFSFLGRPGPYLADLTAPENEGLVRYLGALPHSEALAATASAGLNVILLPDMPGGEGDTTTKIYECLGSGRPILAAVPEKGAAASDLGRFEGVTLCDPNDIAGLASGIAGAYGRWLDGRTHICRSAEALEPFTRKQQARQLADCLDATLGARKYRGGAE